MFAPLKNSLYSRFRTLKLEEKQKKHFRYATYTLNSQEQKTIEYYCTDPSFKKDDLDNQEYLVNAAAQLAPQLSSYLPNLAVAIQKIHSTESPLGLLLVKNLPRVSDPRRLDALMGSLLGQVAKYTGEGDYIIAIKEKVKEAGDRPSFQNSREFYLHIDLSYAPKPPDILAMHSIVNPLDGGGRSIFCDAQAAVSELSFRALQELQKPQFLFPAPRHYQGMSVVQFPILTSAEKPGQWRIRFRRDNLQCLTRPGAEAIVELVKAIDKHTFEIPLEESSFVLVNNRTFLHGRTAFLSSSVTNRPRHLNRIYIDLN